MCGILFVSPYQASNKTETRAIKENNYRGHKGMVQSSFIKMNQVLHRRTGSTIADVNCSAIWQQDWLSDERNSILCEHISKFVKELPRCCSVVLTQNGSVITFVGLSYKTKNVKFQHSIDVTKKLDIINL